MKKTKIVADKLPIGSGNLIKNPYFSPWKQGFKNAPDDWGELGFSNGKKPKVTVKKLGKKVYVTLKLKGTKKRRTK